MLFNKLALALLSVVAVAAALPGPSSANDALGVAEKRGLDDLTVDTRDCSVIAPE